MCSFGIKERMLRESGGNEKSASKGCTLFIWGDKPFEIYSCKIWKIGGKV
jgi:hypothetical protein